MTSRLAAAHSWTGTGDCEGWTLTLDGLWGAKRIEVDGTSYGRQTTITIPDSSDDTTPEEGTVPDELPHTGFGGPLGAALGALVAGGGLLAPTRAKQ